MLPRAGTQTLSQLRAALARAVLVLDPDGAAARHEQRRTDRRVVLGPDGDGMATLWALLSAPDATAAYQRLCQLARGLGAEDPRGMDARRADLLIDLLTGRRCAATATPRSTRRTAPTPTARSAATAPRSHRHRHRTPSTHPPRHRPLPTTAPHPPWPTRPRLLRRHRRRGRASHWSR